MSYNSNLGYNSQKEKEATYRCNSKLFEKNLLTIQNDSKTIKKIQWKNEQRLNCLPIVRTFLSQTKKIKKIQIKGRKDTKVWSAKQLKELILKEDILMFECKKAKTEKFLKMFAVCLWKEKILCFCEVERKTFYIGKYKITREFKN